MCGSCGEMLRFSRSLHVRLLSAEEINRLPEKLLRTLLKGQRLIQMRNVDEKFKQPGPLPQSTT